MALKKHSGKGVFAATALAQVMSGDMGDLTIAIGKPSYNPHTNTLYLPGIPGDDLPEDALRLLRAYLAHEAAERGRSSWDPQDPRWWHPDPTKRKPGLKKLVNAINDARIDLSYQHDYPGAYLNIRWSVERDIQELIRKNRDEPLEPSVNIIATLTRYIGEGLMTVDDIYREFPQLEKHVRKVDHILRNLDISNEDAIVAQAEEIYRILKKPEAPPKEAAPPPPPPPETPEPQEDEDDAEEASQAQQQKAKEQGDKSDTDYDAESPEADEKGQKGEGSEKGQEGDQEGDEDGEEGEESGEGGSGKQGGKEKPEAEDGDDEDDTEQLDPLPGEENNAPKAQTGGEGEDGEEEESEGDDESDGSGAGGSRGEGEDDDSEDDGDDEEWEDEEEDDSDEWGEDDYEDGADQGNKGRSRPDDEDGLDEFNEPENEGEGEPGEGGGEASDAAGQGDEDGEEGEEMDTSPSSPSHQPTDNAGRETPDEDAQVDPNAPPAIEDEADTDHDTSESMLEDIVDQIFGEQDFDHPWAGDRPSSYTWDPTHDTVKLVPHKTAFPLDPGAYSAPAQVLETKLRQALTMPSPRMQRGRERGEVDERNLVKVPMGQTAVFKRRVIQESDSVAASLSWDESTSMNKLLHLVKLLAYTFNKALGGLNIPTEMLGWTTTGTHYNPSVYRQSTIRHLIYKEFRERHTDDKVLRRLNKISTRGITPTAEGLRFALERLAARPEKRKVLFFLTDGQPYMDVNGDTDIHAHYIHTLVERAERAGIEIVGVGIGADLSHHFRRFIVVNNINELRGAVSDMLVKVLREGKRELLGI